MIRTLLPLLALLPIVSAGEVSKENLLRHVTTLASREYGGRSGEGARLAEAYLVAAFQGAGLDTRVQEVATQDGKGARNVVGIRRATVKPGGEHVILSAHYDHIGKLGAVWFPGAADNAAGVAAMLELARLLPAQAARDVFFIAFDREEVGLQGSKGYCESPLRDLDKCVAMLTFDILGRDLADVTKGILFCTGAERSDSLFGVVRETAMPEGLQIVYSGADVVGDRSDFAPFRDSGVPFLFFSAGEYRDYHAATDTPDRLDFGKLLKETEALLAISARVLAAPRAKFLAEPALRVEEAAGLELVVGQLLANKEKIGLSTGEAIMGEALRVSLKQIAASGELTKLQRDQMVATCRLLVSMLQSR